MRSSAATCAPLLVAEMTGCTLVPMECRDVSTNRLERGRDELPLQGPQIAEGQSGLGAEILGHGESWPEWHYPRGVPARLGDHSVLAGRRD